MLPVWGVGQVRGKMYIERFNLCAAILILAAPGLAQPVNFNSPGSYLVYAGGATVSVAVGDFNGDGKPDLVGLAGGNMALLLGNGDGTFRTMDISYDLGGTMVVVADFNGDGKPDLAIIGFDASFSIWLGNGNRPRKRWHTMARERGGRKNVCQVCEPPMAHFTRRRPRKRWHTMAHKKGAKCARVFGLARVLRLGSQIPNT
jgi:hypothetical protein